MFGATPGLFLNLEAACMARGAYEKEESTTWIVMKKVCANGLIFLPVRESDVKYAIEEKWEHLTTAST